MWSKRFCYETIDHFIRGYECGEIDRESAARFALAAAVFGPPDVGAYLADRFYEADVRLARGRGDQPPDRQSWALGVDEHALESLGLRTIEQMAREIQRKPGGLKREIQRQAKALGLTKDPNASFAMGFIRVYRFGGTWLCRIILQAHEGGSPCQAA